jgi:hypothetical protein
MKKKAIIRACGLVLEIEADTQKDLFEGIAQTQEVFCEPNCGLCLCDKIHFVVRTTPDGTVFHELACTNQACRATLSIGQSKKLPGRLFPIRKLTREGKPSRAEGTYDTKHRGWTRYRGSAPAPVVVDEKPW